MGLRPCDRHANSPQRGRPWPPARFACAVPAAPRALPGRGLAPPDPQGCAPWRAFRAPGPCCRSPIRRGFRARVRRWGVGKPQACPCPTPSPSSPWIQFFRWAVRMHGGVRGVPPAGATVGNPAQAVGGQGAAAGCARRPRTGRGCPRATGFRAQRSRLFLPPSGSAGNDMLRIE